MPHICQFIRIGRTADSRTAGDAVNAFDDIGIVVEVRSRDGQVTEMPAPLLVPGDIVLLEAGDANLSQGKVMCAVDVDCRFTEIAASSRIHDIHIFNCDIGGWFYQCAVAIKAAVNVNERLVVI